MARSQAAARIHTIALGLLTGALLGVFAPSATAEPYLPPAGKIFAGVTAGHPRPYERQTGVHAAIFQEFVNWGSKISWAADMAQHNDSRLMLALQLGGMGKHAILSPAQIAAGHGDQWIKWLGNYLFWRAQPTYLRL